MIYHFESPVEFVRAAIDARIDGKTVTARKWDERRTQINRARPDFYGPEVSTCAEVPTLERDAPDPSIEAKAARFAEMLLASAWNDTDATARRWKFAEDGDEVDGVRYAAAHLPGQWDPRFFKRRIRRPRPVKRATVIFSAALSAMHEPGDFAERGAYAAAAVLALSSAGFSVRVVEELSEGRDGGPNRHMPSGDADRRNVTAFITLKNDSAPLDLSALWYGVRTQTTRRANHYFLCAKFAQQGTAYAANLWYPGSIGRAAAIQATGADDARTIYIPHTAERYEIEASIKTGISEMLNTNVA